MVPTLTGQPCTYVLGVNSSIANHLSSRDGKNIHGLSAHFIPVEKRTKITKFQRLCNLKGTLTSTWPVDILRDEIPAAGYADWVSTFRCMHPNGIFPRAEVEIGENAAITPFLEQTGWLSWLNGYSIERLRALIRPAETGDFWDNLKLTALAYTGSITEDEYKSIYFGDKQTLNHWKFGR